VSPNAKMRSKPRRVGGRQTRHDFGSRTASGLRTQNLEIKYKKPTSAARELVRRRTSKNPDKCGEEESQMIRRDSIGSHAEIFYGRQTFEFFPEIKKSNGPSARRSRGSRAFSTLGPRCLWAVGVSEHHRRAFIFQACRGGGGGQKSGIFKRGPWGGRARISAKFGKLFFNRAGPRGAQTQKNCREIEGGG
jgi:hypothetical protein